MFVIVFLLLRNPPKKKSGHCWNSNADGGRRRNSKLCLTLVLSCTSVNLILSLLNCSFFCSELDDVGLKSGKGINSKQSNKTKVLETHCNCLLKLFYGLYVICYLCFDSQGANVIEAKTKDHPQLP